VTPVGRRIVERARLLLRDAEALVAIGAGASRPLSGELALGVLPTIGPFLLPRLMPHLGRRFPDLKLRLREDKTQALLDRLADGRLDLVLMAFPYAAEAFETQELFEDAYHFACRPDHPLEAAATVGGGDLEGEQLMLLEKDHCLHAHALPLLEAAPARAGTSFSATSLQTLVAMVAEGLGTTLLPALAVDAGVVQGSAVVTRPLADAATARRIGLAWRRQSARAEEFRALGDVIRKWAAGRPRQTAA